MPPLGWLGRHDVDVPVEEERRRSALAPDADDQVRPVRILREEARLETRAAKQLGDELEQWPLVPGRVRGVEAQERAQQLDRIHGVRRHRLTIARAVAEFDDSYYAGKLSLS
jgi:hypothetical protein